ncbi:protein split ends-like isoform X2 [Homalodisca vitripennis]|uniref:protein split ends-like isoform X2 n=1 Tax=Homalodisca vitripennis TaxID=197043 RepID=UPI001EEC9FB6|nr:protein split ends-like isoform X2 [Homalodisca vitripennis]
MSGKPEGRVAPPGLQNVLVYVSGDGLYPSNGSGGSYQAAPAVKQPTQPPRLPQPLPQSQPQQLPSQQFYNVQPSQPPVPQNGYQYSVANYNGQGVRTNPVMGGDVGGNVVFPRGSEAESPCSSLSDQDSVSVSGGVPTYKSPLSVAVPIGWKRLHTNGAVIYVSPSNTALSSLDQVKAYLQTQGTCKCGLECPLNCDIVFNFDPKVATRPWTTTSSAPVGDLTKLCNHKRKQLALAANLDHHLDLNSRDGGKKKKRKMVGGYSASVSQLLAQRERDRSKETQQQGWSDVGRDGSPMMAQMQHQSPQSRAVYPPAYNSESHSQQQFYRYAPNCLPQQQGELMGGVVGGSGESYPPGGTGYTQQQNCSGHMNAGMMMGHQYQYQQRMCPGQDGQGMEHHCQQKQQNQQQMLHQQQHFQQQHFQQQPQQMSQHMMQSNSPRPQMQHNMHQQMMNQQIQSPHQHYERMMGQPTGQFQYHQQEHKQMQMMQHQHCVSKQPMQNRENYQRADIPQQVHQMQQGMVLQTSQGQVMLPQHTMVLQQPQQQQQQQNSGMQVSQSQTMIQGSTMVVQSPNPSIQQNHQQNQILMQQHSAQVQQGVQVQIPNQQAVVLQNHQQQNVTQVQSNSSNNNMCSSPAMLMHHQRPAPPWQTNRNNQLTNQNAVINQQQPPQPHNQQQPQPHNQQQQSPQTQVMQSNMFDRVPPLHHHLPSAPVWNDERKKAVAKMQGKPAAHLKNKRPHYMADHHHHNVGASSEQPCPNIDVRHLPQEQNKMPPNQSQPFPSTNIPSFMEDPSGYLAQQTALLNSTISRQTGMNGSGINIICQSPCNTQVNDQNSNQGQVVINLPTSTCSPLGNQGVPLPSNVMLPNQQKQNFVTRVNTNTNQGNNSIKVYRSNSVSSSGYQSQTPNHTQPGMPDSSGVSPDRGRCSQGCSTNNVDGFLLQNQNQSHQSVQNTVTAVKFNPEDSPVTSSTFLDNRQPVQSVSTPDSRGPIQGGTVSTSNRSPIEMVARIPPDDPSPGRTPTPSSTQNRRLDASPESSMFISTSSPFTLANGNTIIYQQQTHSNPNSRQETSTPISQSPKPQQQQQQQQQINLVLQDVHMQRMPTIVTTMASGHTVSSNTITSVLAGRANTATVTVNNQTTTAPPTIPPPVLTNQQMPQVSVSKSPLEMVQSVVSSIQVPPSSTEPVLKPATAPSLPPGHILMSSNGQLIVTNTQGAILSPQQNLTKINTSMPPMSGVSTIVTSVTGAVTQVIPAVGVTQQVLGQPTVLVNTLPAPLLFQPGVMTVDGTMNTVQIPHLAVATGNVLPGQMVDESRVNNSNGAFSPRNQPVLLSPEGSNGKKKGNVKKRKVSPQTVASMLHIAAQQNSPTAGATGMVVQQQQPQQNFSPPMLQALTILPSKTGHFGGTQQLIATGNILQPLNLVQNFPTIQQFIVPAGLGGMVMATGDGTATLLQDTVQLNVLTPMQGPGGTVFGHTSGQSILAAGPAGMVIRTPTNSNQQTGKVQLHPQNSSGNQFIANSPNQFLMNNPAFSGQLSPMLANVSPTNQQIHSFNTNGGNGQGRPNQTHQEFIQCGQTLMVPCSIAQNSSSQNTTVVQQNTTIVQQQTTMVSNNQQNMDQNPGPSTSSSSSLSLNQHNFILNNTDGKQQNFILTTDQKGQGGFILSPNPDKPGTHIILNTDKTQYGGLIISQEKPNQMCGNFILSNSNMQQAEKTSNNFIISGGSVSEKQTMNRFAKHSVSTQTAANQQVLQVSSTPVPTALVVATSNTFCQTSTAPSSYSGSPPDTTTHSPVDGGTSQSPGLNLEAPSSSVTVGSTDDLSSPTSSSDPTRSQPMVHCVSSSNEQDPDWKENPATSPAMFSPPANSMEMVYNRGTGTMKNMSMSSYVESSSATMQTYDNEGLLKRSNDGEMVGRQMYDYSSLARSRSHKRKHPQVCVDSETRIHTSTLSPHDEDDEVVN